MALTLFNVKSTLNFLTIMIIECNIKSCKKCKKLKIGKIEKWLEKIGGNGRVVSKLFSFQNISCF